MDFAVGGIVLASVEFVFEGFREWVDDEVLGGRVVEGADVIVIALEADPCFEGCLVRWLW